jgi:hypothetical protein
VPFKKGELPILTVALWMDTYDRHNFLVLEVKGQSELRKICCTVLLLAYDLGKI